MNLDLESRCHVLLMLLSVVMIVRPACLFPCLFGVIITFEPFADTLLISSIGQSES